MTLKDKKNKREYNRKLKAEGGVSAANKGQEKASTSKKADKSSKGDQVSSFKGAKEDSSQLLTEANQRFNEAEAERQEEEETDSKYGRRNITSNWSRYEIRSDEEEEEENMTGPDYQYVISTAQGAEAHFKFKSEQEWEAAAVNLGELRQEFFSLDLSRLESDMMSLPLYQQICLPEEEVEPELLEIISRKIATKDNLKTAGETEKQISNKMLELLEVKTKHLDIKEKSDQSDHHQPSEQETSTRLPTAEKELAPGLVPLAQRQNRRDMKKKLEEENCETEDLKFLETLDEPQQPSPETVEVDGEDKPSEGADKSSEVVADIRKDTKNLEDWLDDFLDD